MNRQGFLIVFLSISILAAPAGADLLGRWMFDETEGTSVEDSSGEGNHGVVLNNPNPGWTAGTFGGALTLDGANDYVELPIGSVISTLDEATIMIWVDWTGAGGAWQRFVDFGTGQDNYLYIVPLNGATQTLRVAIVAGNGIWNEFDSSEGALATGWHHIAVTLSDTTREMIMYLDGESVGSFQNLGNILSDLGDTNQNWVGRSQYPDPYFDGAVDELQIYNEALAQDEIQTIMNSGVLSQGKAFLPMPVDGQTDIARDGTIVSWAAAFDGVRHDVYFGADLSDVNDAERANPLGTLVSENQTATSHALGRLTLGQTYFWRVDEVNSVTNEIERGSVWSFTAEPPTYALTADHIVATASTVNGGDPATTTTGPENTINGSGLDENDGHSTSADHMWLSDPGDPSPWIQYAFDRVYSLDSMLVWNANQATENIVGWGVKDVEIQTSLDGESWTTLGGVTQFTQSTGRAGASPVEDISLEGLAARTVRLNIANNWGGILPQVSLSEVRFSYIPTHATQPVPDSGAIAIRPDAHLSWRTGREAGMHKVYLSNNESDVADGSALAGNASVSNFPTSALDLQLGETYVWRVDEVNEAEDPSTWTGTLWSFSTSDSIVIDDMESYKDAEFLEIWATWIDGFEDTSNGSLVGNGASGSPETGIVHGGGQSLPLNFDNRSSPVSEVTRTFAQAQDWTRSGIQSLVLHFARDADNTGNGQLYLKINGTRIDYQEAAAPPPGWDVWTQWTIDLSTVGADLTRVTELAIGVEGAAEGVLYVDDILLYRDAPQAALQQVLTWFEAESGQITEPLKVFTGDAAASGGQYIGSDDLIGDENDNPPADGVATYSFDVPEAGVYSLAFRVSVSGGNDSFWVRIPGATTNTTNHASGWVRYNEIAAGDRWHWDEVHSNDDGNSVVEFTLPAGTHSLEIAQREDGTLVDAIAVLR